MSVSTLKLFTEMSRKRSHPGTKDEMCIGGCGNPSCEQKCAPETKGCVKWWYLKLESESEPFDSDEPDSLKNESLWSVQLRDTDSVHDSSDSESRWQQAHDNEFEVASLHSSENELKPFSCSSDDESCSSVEGLVIATVAPDGITIDYFADSSSELSSSDDSSDPELQPQDKWACLRCKQKNQPIPRYCQHCFAVRKKWFPPRPTARKKRKASSFSSISIPPQIQITPNLSIPDLAEMKGDPLADDVQRSYAESVAEYASLTEQQRLDQLKENVRRQKLIRSHSDNEMFNAFNSKSMLFQAEKPLKSIFTSPPRTSMLEKHKLGIQEKRLKDWIEASSCSEDKGEISDDSNKSSVATIPKLNVDKPPAERSQLDLDELDFRAKVNEYLAQTTLLLDTPPSSQNLELSQSPQKSKLLLEEEDVVDSPFCRPPSPLKEDVVDGSIRPLPSSSQEEDVVDSPCQRPLDTSLQEDEEEPSKSEDSVIKICTFCEVNEANTAFIHQGKGHLCACYPCAKKVYASKGQCPICQRQASTICKIYS